MLRPLGWWGNPGTRNAVRSVYGYSSRSQALPGNAYREAPPPLLGASAFANKDDFYGKRRNSYRCARGYRRSVAKYRSSLSYAAGVMALSAVSSSRISPRRKISWIAMPVDSLS